MSDVLSRGEIGALLAAIAAGDVDDGSLQEQFDGPQVRPFDLSRPTKFAREQLGTLETLHENPCRQAFTQLSTQLRRAVEIEFASVDRVSTGWRVVNSLPPPTLIEIVSVEPLEGNAILEINLPVAFSMIDRLVGGPGTIRPRLRELTEIEHALLRSVNDALLNAPSEAWDSVMPVRFRQVGAEMKPPFAERLAVRHGDPDRVRPERGRRHRDDLALPSLSHARADRRLALGVELFLQGRRADPRGPRERRGRGRGRSGADLGRARLGTPAGRGPALARPGRRHPPLDHAGRGRARRQARGVPGPGRDARPARRVQITERVEEPAEGAPG